MAEELALLSDELVYLFLDIDERLFHDQASVGHEVARCKRRVTPAYCEPKTARMASSIV